MWDFCLLHVGVALTHALGFGLWVHPKHFSRCSHGVAGVLNNSQFSGYVGVGGMV